MSLYLIFKRIVQRPVLMFHPFFFFQEEDCPGASANVSPFFLFFPIRFETPRLSRASELHNGSLPSVPHVDPCFHTVRWFFHDDAFTAFHADTKNYWCLRRHFSVPAVPAV